METMEKRSIWIPMLKTGENVLTGILSDNSVDRDEEFIGDELLEEWSRGKALPALKNHDNKMESFTGLWKNLKLLVKGKKKALKADLTIFKKNPHTSWIEDFLKEIYDEGGECGVSISAIPKKYEEVEVDGFKKLKWITAELLEATLVPIQSNRNSVTTLAKSFGLNINRYVPEKKQSPLGSEDGKNVNIQSTEVVGMTENTPQGTKAVGDKIEFEALKKEIEELRNKNVELEKNFKSIEAQKQTIDKDELLKALSEEAKKQFEPKKVNLVEKEVYSLMDLQKASLRQFDQI